MTFAEFKKIRDKSFKLGRVSDAERERAIAYINHAHKCPACGANTCDEDAFDQGVQECRRCHRPFCWHCGGEDGYCRKCLEHEESRPLGEEHNG